MTTRAKSGVEGIFYYGKVCQWHPNANGRRYSKNCQCVLCKRVLATAQRQRRGPSVRDASPKIGADLFNAWHQAWYGNGNPA